MDNSGITKKISSSIFENGVEGSIIDNNKLSNDPYWFMIAGENINYLEPLSNSHIRNTGMIEAKRFAINEKINSTRWKRDQELLETQLKEFQTKLCGPRRKFGETSQINNSKQRINSSIDNIKSSENSKKVNLSKIKVSGCNHFHFDKVITNDKHNTMVDEYDHLTKDQSESSSTTKAITVIIKDKPVVSVRDEKLEILRVVFDSLRAYVSEAKHLQQIKSKIQQNIIIRKLRRFFNAWRNKINCTKQLAAKNKEQYELRDIKKIELFVNMIKNKQKTYRKSCMNNNTKISNKLGNNNATSEFIESNKSMRQKFVNTAEPLNNRLKVQKKIIAEQKMKLAEQNRLIEEMKLKQMEIESRINGMETINIAKTILNNCNSSSRRELLAQFVRKNDYEQEINGKSCNSSSAKFPMHLEARASIRKQRIRQRHIEYEKKLYNEKLKEEAMKIEEQKFRKQLQRDAEKQTKLIREEHERKKAESIERTKILNESADNHYHKYLLRNCILKPLKLLVQKNYYKMAVAISHYNTHQLRKTFITWKNKVQLQSQIKLESAISIYNRNLLWYYLQQWRDGTKIENFKYQVACDIYDLRLQEKYFNIWTAVIIEIKINNNENEKKAQYFAFEMIKKKYFLRWKKYMTISDQLKEIDKRRDQWRQVVQTIIPDFAPKYRGVLIDD